MSLIDREKNILLQTAENKCENYKDKIFHSDDALNSFYIDAEQDKDSLLCEYDFASTQELERMLIELASKQGLPEDVIKPIVVAAYKLKDINYTGELPETIYNF